MLADRRVKIVATMGPSTRTPESIESCIRAGMNVARLNFSHGSHEDHLKTIQYIRRISEDLSAPVTILQDLQGPKIRVGKFEGGGIQLVAGEKVTLTMEPVLGKPGLIPSDFKELARSVKPGSKILLDDGLIEMRVLSAQDPLVQAEVIFGGFLKDRKGMNCPGIFLPVECLTPKDLADLQFGIAQKVDYVALSFVREAKDIRILRELLQKAGSMARICAKIEMIEAIENLEEIVRLSDAVMVARGDLAVEIGQSKLPSAQKRIISVCNELNRPVITATQMLDSMVENPRPTRAEITDVANAVIDGSDALMLSAETASGKHPSRCIETMHEIIQDVELSIDRYYRISLENEFLGIPGSIAVSASLSALKLDAKVIVCLTTTGKTATMISAYRPRARIIAVTDQLGTLNQMELVWGIQTLAIKPYQKLSEVVPQVERQLIEYGLAFPGDKIILTYGHPISEAAKTNSIHIFNLNGESYQKSEDAAVPLRCRQTSVSSL